MNNFLNGANNGKQCLSKKFNRIESFMQNKTSGNDGPTSEFYLPFGNLLENHFIDFLHFSHVHDQLCSSQRRLLVIILRNKIRVVV